MKVSFSIGEKSKTIINTLKQSADNIDFYSYPTIADLVKDSMMRHIPFNRIVFSSEILSKTDPEGDLRQLNDFIKNYSDTTELVLIVKGNNAKSHIIMGTFNKLFNSPMYTPIILDKATPNSLLQVVSGDIDQLRAQYYTLDVNNDKVITSSSGGNETVQQPITEVKPPVQEKKKGLLGRFLGSGAKKPAEIVQPVVVPHQVPVGVTLPTETVPESSTPFTNGPQSVFSGFSDEIDGKEEHAEKEGEEVSDVGENHAIPEEVEDLTGNNSEVGTDEDDLSVGEFGSLHSDTDFLDEEEDDELKKFSESLGNSVSEVIEEQEKEKQKSEESAEIKPINDKEYLENVKELIVIRSKESTSSINLCLAIKGSGLSQFLVDTAVNLQERGKKVLLVDLDYKENGLLSFINVEEFYHSMCNGGINSYTVYTEDGVDVLSNGYGECILREQISCLLKSNFIKHYDEVLIDCPMECLDLLDEGIASSCSLYILSKGDRGSLLSTSMALTNRSNVSIKLEKLLMSKSSVLIFEDDYTEEDINLVKEICLLANGSWLE